jgi:hypothetical protein
MTLKNKWSSKLPEVVTVDIFTQAIKSKDAVAFWNILCREGQGYIRGCWYGGQLSNRKISKVLKLPKLEEFNLESPLVVSWLEQIITMTFYRPPWETIIAAGFGTSRVAHSEDGLFAQVKIFCNHGDSPVTFIKPAGDQGLIIPLIVELNGIGPSGARTTWAIDYLKIGQLNQTQNNSSQPNAE